MAGARGDDVTDLANSLYDNTLRLFATAAS